MADGDESDKFTMQALFQEIASIKASQRESLLSESQKINEKLDNIHTTLQPIREEVVKHSKEIKYLDHDKRRKNLIIFGLEDNANESVPELENKILNLLVRTMGLTNFSLFELDFSRRIRSRSTPRPVLIGLTTQRRKFEVLRNKGKLRGSRIFINEDASPEVREQEKSLKGEMNRLRSEGKYAVIRSGRLITRDNNTTEPSSSRTFNKRALSESPVVAPDYYKRANFNTSVSSDFMDDTLMEIQDSPSSQVNERQSVQSKQSIVPSSTGVIPSVLSSESILRTPVLTVGSVTSSPLATGGSSGMAPRGALSAKSVKEKAKMPPTNRNATQTSIKDYVQNFEVILDKYSTELIKQDWDRLTVSTYYELYKELKPRVEITSSKENFTSSYLLMRVPIDRIRTAAQLRLCGRYVKFYIGNMSHTWDSEEVCSICNQQRKESIQHFLMECPQYCPIRKRFLDSILSRPGSSITNLLEMKSKEDVNNIFFFVQSALKIRSFILRE
ncbi:hypothetical protein M8J76_016081 [Diaphorina citri]|nr:hypothetical protein M8J76_016081 [Diaphorina citri]